MSVIVIGHSLRSTDINSSSPLRINTFCEDEDDSSDHSPTRPLMRGSIVSSNMSRETQEELYNNIAYTILQLDHRSAASSPVVTAFSEAFPGDGRWTDDVDESLMMTHTNMSYAGHLADFFVSTQNYFRSSPVFIFVNKMIDLFIPTAHQHACSQVCEINLLLLTIQFLVTVLLLSLISSNLHFVLL